MDYSASEPTAIRAGDTARWTRELPEHSTADGWSLKYRLLYPAGTAIDITTSGAGTLHTVALTSTQTAAWTPGAATLVAYAEKGSGPTLERITLESQALTVLPNLATDAIHDRRSQAEKGLSDAKIALAAYMAGGRLHVSEYEIAGRRMKFRTADEIQALIEYYEVEVGKERAAMAVMSGGSPGRIITRM